MLMSLVCLTSGIFKIVKCRAMKRLGGVRTVHGQHGQRREDLPASSPSISATTAHRVRCLQTRPSRLDTHLRAGSSCRLRQWEYQCRCPARLSHNLLISPRPSATIAVLRVFRLTNRDTAPRGWSRIPCTSARPYRIVPVQTTTNPSIKDSS